VLSVNLFSLSQPYGHTPLVLTFHIGSSSERRHLAYIFIQFATEASAPCWLPPLLQLLTYLQFFARDFERPGSGGAPSLEEEGERKGSEARRIRDILA
jgi:hypothetical protein